MTTCTPFCERASPKNACNLAASPEANHYLDTLFSDSYASELAASGSTRNTAHARRLFYLSLLATLTKIIRRRLMGSLMVRAAQASPDSVGFG